MIQNLVMMTQKNQFKKLDYSHNTICFSKRKLGTLKSDSTKIHSKPIKTLTV